MGRSAKINRKPNKATKQSGKKKSDNRKKMRKDKKDKKRGGNVKERDGDQVMG